MSGATKTRTQRRMEKRQAIVLLLLVLVASLVSFTLGVMVGKRSAEHDIAVQQTRVERVLVAETPDKNMGNAADAIDVTEPEVAGAPITEEPEKDPKLSFYEDISKESAPLGSGINVAPPVVKDGAEKPPIPLPEQPVLVKTVSPQSNTTQVAPAPSQPVVEEKASVVASNGLPDPVSGGSHVVQVGSFSAQKDARALQQRLMKKSYPAFVVDADLGEKGRWFRVRVGPYADSDQASLAQKVLAEKEKIKGFVSRN